ncbi:MAG: hypothetical protein LLG45_00765 [Actinomycetia bacterium]|nr:hypothetical protein [Actinomycetes bacterium]
MRRKNRFITILVAMVAVVALFVALAPAALATPTILVKNVAAGETWVVPETTRVNTLTIAVGGTIKAPEGYSVTMTIDGIETGQVLATTAGLDMMFVPGTYFDALLTVAEENLVPYVAAGPGGQTHLFPFRQAIYVDAGGYDPAKSVPAAVTAGSVGDTSAKDVAITSTGENFTGIYVGGGSYTILRPKIRLTGNGRSDFIGTGAALTVNGGATVVVDGASIENTGVARAGVVADGGANVVVKNSHIQTKNGVLPSDYIPTIDTFQMRSVPWMLGLSGNVRATNLLGTNTKASYINSYIGSEGWGVLSTDGCTTPTLTAINSTIAITGKDGYGSYGIGDATEYFYGCTFDVATYSTISRGSHLYYGDSDRSTVKKLNEDLDLGLTTGELAALTPRNTVVNSDKFGVMWHGGGTLDVSGGTVFNTEKTTFLDKGQAITITVDGSEGARLLPGNGVIMQLMDDDDPGPNFADMTNTNIYTEPTTPPVKAADFDVTAVNSGYAKATFSNIVLGGDFYNSAKGGSASLAAAADEPPAGGDAGGPPPGGPGGPPPGGGGAPGQNLVLTFDNATITGVVSASIAHHYMLDPGVFTIGADEYYKLGEVVNTPGPAVNNGVIVTLKNNSKWIVTKTSYLTKLTFEGNGAISAPAGYKVSLSVDGVPKLLKPGTYTGAIVLKVTPLKVFSGTSLAPRVLPATD